MRLSVALCTYQGAPYLERQLASIAAQRRLPDEIIVCDDGSVDGTVDIVENWAGEVPFPVRIYMNNANAGVVKNFERAIGLCDADVIALADQDDVWHSEKLAIAVDVLEGSPTIAMVFSDADVVDSQLQPLGYRMWRTRRFRRAEQRLMGSHRAVEVLLRRNVVTGATMAFRAQYRDLVMPIPDNPIHVHDEWIAFLLAAVAEVRPLCRPLMQYRQQPGQVIGAHPPTGIRMLLDAASTNSRSANLDAHRATIDWFEALRDRLVRRRDTYPFDPLTIDLIDGKIDHLHDRIALPESRPRRAVNIAADLISLRYHRYSIGMWAAAKDLTA